MKGQDYSLSSVERSSVRRLLLKWFSANQRDLPWRASRDPYAIWVSEVMLQQTQVNAVIPYYVRFMNLFPTIRKLADADEQEVLRCWEGLGYYRRARHLHQAAQDIVSKHAGVFPQDAEQLSQLSGLGRYTVGAVLSQAFDQRLPVVDANVARVLCRLHAWPNELEAKTTQDWLWETAEAMLPPQHPGDFNQALMELGQTICKTGQPDCLLCPLRDLCRGHASGLSAALPRRRSKVPQETVLECAVIVRKKNHILLCQRSSKAARWANMWEFPTFSPQGTGRNNVSEQAIELTGCQLQTVSPLGSLQYGITRFKVTLEVKEARYAGGRLHQRHYQKLLWVKPAQLSDYPLSVPHRKLAQQWLSPE